MKKCVKLIILSILCISMTFATTFLMSCDHKDLIGNGLQFTFDDFSSTYRVSDYTGRSESIIIPSTYNGYAVTSIGDYAFFHCTSIENITIPDSVTSIGNSAFDGCSSLTSVEIPDSVTSIGNNAFDDCSKLTSVTISDSVTSIGNNAFSSCLSLTSITIPDSVESIGNNVFSSCRNLMSITVEENNEYYKSIDGNLYSKDGTTLIQYAIAKTDTSFIIPDSVTSIGENAFSWCSSLTSITIGNSVTNIGKRAFADCLGLTNLTVPDSVTEIRDSTFSGCSNLINVTIPDSVTSIGNYTFSDCRSLMSITVEENNEYYKSIDGNLYSKDGTILIQYATAKSDTVFIIPDSVTSIGNYAFADCDSLTNMNIPDNVTSIGSSAFLDCEGIAGVTIGKCVTSIGRSAFYNCSSLTSITFEDTSTWYRTEIHSDWINMTGGTVTSVVDPSDYMTHFNSSYWDYYWYKK